MKSPRFNFVLVSIFIIFFSACQKEENNKPLPNKEYPLTYSALTPEKWDAKNIEFQEINRNKGLILNKYGFIEGSIPLIETDSITKEYIFENINSLVNNYREFMGIPSKKSFNLENEVTVDAFYLIPGGRQSLGEYFKDIKFMKKEGYINQNNQDKLSYKFYLTQKQIEDKYLLGSEIVFDFGDKQNSLTISGYWLPNVFIPQNEIYSKDEAIAIAWREILQRKGIDMWELKHNFSANKIMQKVEKKATIEIRDCWHVYLSKPPYNGFSISIFIDTQTGEVVKYYDAL